MHTDSERDRPELKFRESYDSIVSDYRKSLKRIDDALVLKGLSLSEAYIEGRARIAVEFAPHPFLEANRTRLITVWNNQRHIAKSPASRVPTAVQNIEAFDSHNCFGANQDMMFVGNIESMDAENFIPINLERLYFIKNESQNLSAGEGSCFLSVNGGFRVLPRVSERELSPPVDGPAIGLDKVAISVIEGRAQVVDGVTDDCRGVPRQSAADGSIFPAVRIGLRPQGFDVVHHVGPNNRFKLLDVMIGPFYF